MRIFIATGEVSGDIQGALVAKKLIELDDSMELVGFGGHRMHISGVENIYDMSTMSTMGILEGMNPILAFKKLGAFNKLKEYIEANPIDMMLLVDNQGINLLLVEYCKKNNIPCIYYFPPHVGIWGRWNAKKLRSCKSVITQFAFDYDVYKKSNCNVMFSGHPFVDLKNVEPKPLNIPSKKYTVGVLFGSRMQEINKLSPVFIQSMALLNKMFSGNIRFLIPIAYPEYRKTIDSIMKKHSKLLDGLCYTLLENDETESVYAHSDVIILSSGTSSLIASCYEKPMVICYKISYITYFIARFFVKGGFVGMPNIILGKSVVPELLQSDCNSDAITDQVMHYLTDENIYNSVKKELADVKKHLGDKNVIERVAKEIIKLTKECIKK